VVKHLKLFENFEVVEPIKYGDPLNSKEIKFLEGFNIPCPEFILKDDNYYYVFNHRCEKIKDVFLTYVHAVCSKLNIQNYKINDDFTIDVNGSVDCSVDLKYFFDKIPLNFNKVYGDFRFSNNNLTTLEGSPNWVGGYFNCGYNELTTLEGAPEYVGGDFWCNDNQLTNLEGAPTYVGHSFGCSFNQLTTLEGSPKWVGDNFACAYNELTTLEGGPEYVGGDFYCYDNPLESTEYKGTIKGKLVDIWNI
jgi:hypothetical protein